jgi:threonine synthase
MGRVSSLRCDACGTAYRPGEILYTCPGCGPRWGTLTIEYDLAEVRRRLGRESLGRDPERSIWRYFDLLPVGDRAAVPAPRVGGTPLYEAPRLAAELGVRTLYLKDDALNPSASLKDRASAVLVARAREIGAQAVTAASTGNAASSVSLFAAWAGLPCYIFVPEGTAEAKLAQMAIFGAHVVKVQGTYDQAFDLSVEASRAWGWFNRGSAYNPVLCEGKKTVALEICEQTGFDPPDVVAVPVGDGCILGGVWKGFCEAHALGLVERRPRLVGVQAEGAAPLYRAWKEGADRPRPSACQTLADGIAVGDPRDALKALRAVRESGGAFVTVSDEEILGAMRDLARSAGVFAESAAAAALAGLRRHAREGGLRPGERAAVLLTGAGIKDVKNALRAAARPPVSAPPDLEEVRKVLAL